ncbi:hypothetical protein [Apilactobacillus waqarii]|uniref:hypothetical protein n=1 Tax=Apilactobacillus waqarii TaxID=2851006 RepID=UPI003364F85D
MSVTLINSGEKFYLVKGIDSELFDTSLQDLDTNYIEYDPNVLLDDYSAYKISKFSEKKYCPDILKEDYYDTEYDEYLSRFDKNYLLNIVDNKYFFQKVTPSMIRPRKILKIAETNSFEKTEKGKNISINNCPDAIYDKSKDILIFFKLNKISNIFKGISELYKSATDEEVKSFLSQSFIKTNNFSFKDVKVNNRKKIALLQDKYSKLTDKNKIKLKKYIKNYCPNLSVTQNDEFEICSNKQLNTLLYGLDESYYIKPIENEKYVSNSSIKIE